MNSEKVSKILIIDDSPIDINIINKILKEEYKTFFAKDGYKGIEVALKELPDIILIDIMMPGMDGYDVCRNLKNYPETKDIPIVFITAKDETEFEEKGLKAGAIDYIIKPFNPNVLKLRIKNHVELKRSKDLLRQMSYIDGLTGIYNRRLFDQTIEREWRRAIRNSSEISLIMIDIDYFKKYNDTYGHIEGDNCLKKISKVLTTGVKRAGDFCARYGGEEFVILLPDTRLENAEDIAGKIRKNVEDLRIEHRDSEISDFVTISLGVASKIPEINDADYSILIESADKALYFAKNNGRNRVEKINI
ncbi:MAG: diguanylate cyclase [Thermotogae bacterium]|jgi:diguanylate cyclase (GGDEF)-like protein|nr:diguanylate cyclase [Thermotogota bacterium]